MHAMIETGMEKVSNQNQKAPSGFSSRTALSTRWFLRRIIPIWISVWMSGLSVLVSAVRSLSRSWSTSSADSELSKS